MAKIINKKLHGGAHPIFLCPCGGQINPQGKGLRPVTARILYCRSDCSYRPVVKGAP